MHPDTFFRIAAALIFVTMFTVAGAFRGRADRDRGALSRTEDPLAFRVTALSAALVVMAAFLLFLVYPSAIRWATLALPVWIRALGLALSLLMLPLIVWMYRHLGSNVSPTAATREEQELITTGPYRFIRHPLYTFGFCAWLGISLMAANWLMMVALFVGFAAIVGRTRIEERNLVKKFGDGYRDYMARTGRFLPRFRRNSASHRVSD